jgi:hypothetical protein
MALDLGTITDALKTHAAASGIYEAVTGHGVVEPHAGGLAWWCMVDDIFPYAAGSGLNTVTACVVYKIITTLNDSTTDPQELVDPLVANGADALLRLYMSNFTLGGLVRNVDIMGAAGVRVSAKAGWMTLDNARYRAMIITLPLIVNNLWDEVA